MDKLSIKKFAIWARNELLKRVSTRAEWFGITSKGVADLDDRDVTGKLLSPSEIAQKTALIDKIQRDGYQQAMEEAAYIWFNRFCALRFMEVNGYLPSRVFSDEQGGFNPQILVEAIHLGDKIKGLDVEKVFEMKEANQRDALYKYLLITQCEALKETLPGMFDKLDDYSELLFPDFLLREESVIEQMVLMIPEDDWKDQVQIIGWLYQYYNTEPKDAVFANLKKNIKINKDNIPAATQLFTPDWIVRYMVENALGRLWAQGHDAHDLIKEWKYFLEEAEQEPDVEAQLAEIRKQYAGMKPEDIKCIDPCMGSGHILVYMFDVLVQIYESYGYNAREAAALILQHNLYGLDIDDRAAQLAYFAVMMKARQYDRRILSRGIAPHIYAIPDSSLVETFEVGYFCGNDASLEKAVRTILKELTDAKEYGSILSVSPQDWDAIHARYDALDDKAHVAHLTQVLRVAEVLASKFDVVVTNPPYMGSSGMNPKLAEYIKKNYSDSKSDLFAVFIERCAEYAKPNGYFAMITQHAWMFLSSFEKLRAKLQHIDCINMAHLGARAFEEIGGEVVQTTSFVMQKQHIEDYQGMYCRLLEPTSQQGKEDMFIAGENRYVAKQSNFSKIPGSPVAYWVGEKIYRAFENGVPFKDIGYPKAGITTGDNNLYLKLWWEILHLNINYNCFDYSDINDYKWFPCNKGGAYRKWYGNRDYIINYSNSAQASMRLLPGYRPVNLNMQFKTCISWSDISSGESSFRIIPDGTIFDHVGISSFPKKDNLLSILGLLNSSISKYLLKIISPTMHCNAGDIAKLPIILSKNIHSRVDALVSENISLSRADWDAFETSWDFVKHPLL